MLRTKYRKIKTYSVPIKKEVANDDDYDDDDDDDDDDMMMAKKRNQLNID